MAFFHLLCAAQLAVVELACEPQSFAAANENEQHGTITTECTKPAQIGLLHKLRCKLVQVESELVHSDVYHCNPEASGL